MRNRKEKLMLTIEQINKLEQENAELKEKIKKYATINEQETKDYAELKAENERLKKDKIGLHSEIKQLEQENAELKAELDTYKKIWSNPEVHVALVDVRTGERKLWYENCLKYKQTLQEIKEIAENYLIKGCEPQSIPHQMKLRGKEELSMVILDLINKSEVAE
jgi:chromosome segregation ATPase